MLIIFLEEAFSLRKVLALQKMQVKGNKKGWEPGSTLSFVCNPISSYESVAKC